MGAAEFYNFCGVIDLAAGIGIVIVANNMLLTLLLKHFSRYWGCVGAAMCSRFSIEWLHRVLRFPLRHQEKMLE